MISIPTLRDPDHHAARAKSAPEQTARGLANSEKYGDGRVEAVCQSALAFDVVDVVRITRMLKKATKPASPTKADGKVVQLVLPRFARPEQHFRTRATTTKKDEGL